MLIEYFDEYFTEEEWNMRRGKGTIWFINKKHLIAVEYFTLSGDIQINFATAMPYISEILDIIKELSNVKGLYIERLLVNRFMSPKNKKELYSVSLRVYNTKNSEWEGAEKQLISVLKFIDYLINEKKVAKSQKGADETLELIKYLHKQLYSY